MAANPPPAELVRLPAVGGLTYLKLPEEHPYAHKFGTDARVLPAGMGGLPGCLYIKYYLFEATIGACVCLAPNEDGSEHWLGTHEMALDDALSLFGQILQCDPPPQGGSAARLMAEIKQVRVPGETAAAKELTPEKAKALVFPDGAFQALAGPMAPPAAATCRSIVGLGLSFEVLGSSRMPRGTLGDLLYMAGPRNSGALEDGGQFDAVAERLLVAAGEFTCSAVDFGNLGAAPEFVTGASNKSLASPLEELLPAISLHYHLKQEYGHAPLHVVTEIAARLRILQGVDESFIIRRIVLTKFPSISAVVGPQSAQTDVAVGVLCRGLLDSKSADKIHSLACFRRVDDLSRQLLGALSGCSEDDPHARVSLVLDFQAKARKEEAIALATASKASTGTGVVGEVFQTRHISALTRCSREPDFLRGAADLRVTAATGNWAGYWAQFFELVSQGVILLPRALAWHISNKPLPGTQLFYEDMRSMLPYISRYFALCLTRDSSGRKSRPEMAAYVLPQKVLKLLLTGALTELVEEVLAFAYEHYRSVEMSLPEPARRKGKPDLTADLLLGVQRFMDPLLEAYGINKGPRGFGHIVTETTNILLRCPATLEALGQANARAFFWTAVEESGQAWKISLSATGTAKFSSTLLPELTPQSDLVLHLFDKRIGTATDFAALGLVVSPQAAPRAKKTGADEKEPPNKRLKAADKLARAPPSGDHVQFEELDHGPTHTTRFVQPREGEAFALRYDLEKIAADLKVGLDERNWGYCLCINNPSRFAEDGGKDKRRHATLSREQKLAYGRSPFAAKVDFQK